MNAACMHRNGELHQVASPILGMLTRTGDSDMGKFGVANLPFRAYMMASYYRYL
jgi:hypothetical protein